MAGFMGKFYVFKSAWVSSPNLRWLVIVAIVNSIILIYLLLYPIVVMFFRAPVTKDSSTRINVMAQIALAITLIGALYSACSEWRAENLAAKSAIAPQIAIQK